ncbi:hypothetical protein [Alkalibacterium psychrotolerans]
MKEEVKISVLLSDHGQVRAMENLVLKGIWSVFCKVLAFNKPEIGWNREKTRPYTDGGNLSV